jgi:hypothetical protein
VLSHWPQAPSAGQWFKRCQRRIRIGFQDGQGLQFPEKGPNSKPPLLAMWGKNVPFFIPSGAEAYLRDNPNATVQFLDTGPLALETHVERSLPL